jgi:hypothetical protein
MVYSSSHSLWKGRQYFHGYSMIDQKRRLHMLGDVTSLMRGGGDRGAVLLKSTCCVFSSVRWHCCSAMHLSHGPE